VCEVEKNIEIKKGMRNKNILNLFQKYYFNSKKILFAINKLKFLFSFHVSLKTHDIMKHKNKGMCLFAVVVVVAENERGKGGQLNVCVSFYRKKNLSNHAI